MNSSITPSIRAACRWFRERCGYSTPPGRAACALRLAKAEQWAREQGIQFRWEPDPEPYETDLLNDQPTEVYGCIAYCPCDNEEHCDRCDGWHHLASLWGIGDPDADYRRLVEAELAMEAMP